MPTAILERKKISRVIFSVLPSSHDLQKISALMKKGYGAEGWCFDLPSAKHLDSFRELKDLTEDETLTGFCHLEAEQGIVFFGKPLHLFESRVVATIEKNLGLPDGVRNLLPRHSSWEVFTQKEIDRITFDPSRFEKALSAFKPEETPFLLLGERYGDWILALGRIDLLKEMVKRVRERGFIPIYSGQWATFALPKAKSLDVAAYAIPINKKWSLFDLPHACDLIKKFDKPIISLNPLADGRLLKKAEEAFQFLFKELKICASIVTIGSESESGMILGALERVPSLISYRKT
jgi:hypothetical protein